MNPAEEQDLIREFGEVVRSPNKALSAEDRFTIVIDRANNFDSPYR
jgi:hypothetical protein